MSPADLYTPTSVADYFNKVGYRVADLFHYCGFFTNEGDLLLNCSQVATFLYNENDGQCATFDLSGQKQQVAGAFRRQSRLELTRNRSIRGVASILYYTYASHAVRDPAQRIFVWLTQILDFE